MAELTQIAQVSLERLPVRVSNVIDPRLGHAFRSSLELEKHIETQIDRMVYDLCAYVLAEQVVNETITREAFFQHAVTYPSSWWQHFKQDVLSKTRLTLWFVKWKPVRFTTKRKRDRAVLEVDLKQYVSFPAADLILTPEQIHRGLLVQKDFVSVDYTGPRNAW